MRLLALICLLASVNAVFSNSTTNLIRRELRTLNVLVQPTPASPFGRDESGDYLAGKDGALIFELEQYLNVKFHYQVIRNGFKTEIFRNKPCYIKCLRGINFVATKQRNHKNM